MEACKIIESTPDKDGFYMPAEFSKHYGTLMIWPKRPGSWIYGGVGAKKVFSKIAKEISKHEEMYMLVSKECLLEAKEMLSEEIKIIELESDDAWARDVCPTFVIDQKKMIRGINWSFNAWGGEYDGLYSSWELDDKLAKQVLQCLNIGCYDASGFVLEGGSIHSDGEGTLLVTESCLLSKGRNPELTKQQIEDKLKTYCGVQKVIWLPCGIYQDETNEHVDNVCAFTAPGEVVLAWTEDFNDPQYEMSRRCMDVLMEQKDAKGRSLKVRKLLIPKNPVCITEEELAGFVFEEGEEERQDGERLAASYVNFYIANGIILVPTFEDEHDALAIATLQEAFPDREIVPIAARDIIVGGGNIHCITQQIPYFLMK